jgi:DNA-binding XRE family transcriptional regulator
MAKEKTTARARTEGNKEAKKELAYYLFMSKVPQKDIAQRVGVTEKTVTKWKEDGNWEAKRSAKTISMDELVTKALGKINELLDSSDFKADDFAKAVAQLKTLKTSNTVDDEIMTFMAFQNYLLQNRNAEGLTEEFIKQVVRQQDNYVQIRLGNG